MTKAIKFNLILDGKAVRNLEELQDNFNIEDVLVACRNGLLNRWLETRGFTEEISALEEIPEDDVEAAKLLCQVFHVKLTNKQIETAAYPFAFRQREIFRLDRYKELEGKRNEIIREYHGNYAKLLSSIEDESKNYPFIKSALDTIYKNYFELYLLDSRAFYERFVKQHPLVILGVLANSNMRPFIPKEISQVKLDIGINWQNTELAHVQTFSGVTEGYWKDLRPKGTSYLVIEMLSGNFIRNCGANGEELNANDVNGKFPILDGIDYKSNSSIAKLVYMEI